MLPTTVSTGAVTIPVKLGLAIGARNSICALAATTLALTELIAVACAAALAYKFTICALAAVMLPRSPASSVA